MTKIKTRDLEGAALNWAVAKAEGYKPLYPCYPKGALTRGEKNPTWDDGSYVWLVELNYYNNWRLAGPIIEREKLAVVYRAGGYWLSYTFDGAEFEGTGPTPLIAAMRCYVVSKLGDEADIPDELIGGKP